MPALEEKGLVTRTVFGKQHKYVPEHPQRLRLVYAKFKARFEDLLPELERVYDRHEKKPVVRFNHGVKGMRLALEDLISTLQVGGTFYRYSSHNAAKAWQKYIPNGFKEKLDNRNINRYMITDKLAEWQKKNHLLKNYVEIPGRYGMFDQNTSYIVYGNKVAFYDFRSESIIIIENEVIAESQRNFFMLLYTLLNDERRRKEGALGRSEIMA